MAPSDYSRYSDLFYNSVWIVGAIGFFLIFAHSIRQYGNLRVYSRYAVSLAVVVFLFVSIISISIFNSKLVVETQAETAAPKNVLVDITTDPELILISWETDTKTSEYLFYRVAGYDTLIIAAPVNEAGLSTKHKIKIPKRPGSTDYTFQIHYGSKIFKESNGQRFEFSTDF